VAEDREAGGHARGVTRGRAVCYSATSALGDVDDGLLAEFGTRVFVGTN
jgi:hypothetical protein